jgi:uncharacterized protein YdhG (YjbR/CyaY superfamily)
MITRKLKPTTIKEYIEAARPDIQSRLLQMHECITESAPRAEEGLKWGMPAYSYKRILVTFAVFKNHIGFYPTPFVIKTFEKQLEKYKTAESSVQFPHNQKFPLELINKMVKFRVKNSLIDDGKWKL